MVVCLQLYILLMSVDKLLVGVFPLYFLILLCFPGVSILLAWSREPRDMGRAVWGGRFRAEAKSSSVEEG